MNGSLTAPITYLANRAVRAITGPVTSPITPAPVPNPRANPAYASQVFSPDYINRIARTQVTGQPVMLPEVVVTASRSNTPAGTVAGTVTGTAQSKPSVKAPVARTQVTGQPVMLPEVVVTAPRINNQPAPAYDTNTL